MRPASAPTPGRVGCARVHEAVTALVRAAGTPEDVVAVAADALVSANLAGHDSHGVLHLAGYLEQAASGHIVVDARPAVLNLKESAGMALVDARGGWGAYGAMISMDLAVGKARANGVGAVSLANSRHIGRLGALAKGHRTFMEMRELSGSDNVYANVDPSNYVVVGQDVCEAVRELRALVRGAHLKDVIMAEGGPYWAPPGSGEVSTFG